MIELQKTLKQKNEKEFEDFKNQVKEQCDKDKKEIE